MGTGIESCRNSLLTIFGFASQPFFYFPFPFSGSLEWCARTSVGATPSLSLTDGFESRETRIFLFFLSSLLSPLWLGYNCLISSFASPLSTIFIMFPLLSLALSNGICLLSSLCHFFIFPLLSLATGLEGGGRFFSFFKKKCRALGDAGGYIHIRHTYMAYTHKQTV